MLSHSYLVKVCFSFLHFAYKGDTETYTHAPVYPNQDLANSRDERNKRQILLDAYYAPSSILAAVNNYQNK